MKAKSLSLVALLVVALFAFPPLLNAASYSLGITTDKTVYSVGETVRISGTILKDGKPLLGAAIAIAVTKPAGATIPVDQVTSDRDGAFQSQLVLSADDPQGVYTLSAATAGTRTDVNFSVGSVTDTTPPTSMILQPLNGVTLTATPIVIAGTATDNVGLTRVEVSLDGGQTWKLAGGTISWTYQWVDPTNGTYLLRSRATDLSGNVESLSQGTQVTVSLPPPSPTPTPTPSSSPTPTTSPSPTSSPTPSPTPTPTSSPSPSSTITPTTPTSLPGFPDIADHWARKQIEDLASKDLISGYPDGLFRPDSPITRAEFTKILVLALNLEPITPVTAQFQDVPPDFWGFSYVETAAAMGIVKGVGQGRFDPSAPIIRADIATMIARAILLNPQPADQFTDAAQIPEYATGFVGSASAKGLITGYPDGSFRPMNLATRAEAAVMIARLLAL